MLASNPVILDSPIMFSSENPPRKRASPRAIPWNLRGELRVTTCSPTPARGVNREGSQGARRLNVWMDIGMTPEEIARIRNLSSPIRATTENVARQERTQDTYWLLEAEVMPDVFRAQNL